jgi:hypothetical protein
MRLALGVTVLGVASLACAQKHVQSTLDSRIVLAYKVNAAEIQRWIPAPWQVAPVASGPAKDANLTMTFVDRLLDQDAEGKPVKTPTYRVVALSVPATNPQTKDSGGLIVRLYNSSPESIPGFYKTAVLATVDREITEKGSGASTASVLERWGMKDGKGGSLELLVQYQRGIATRSKLEAKPRSGSDPATWRIYRIEQATEVLKSIHGGTDRVQAVNLRVKVPELAKLFDGSEQLVAVTSVPMYTRQTFLPEL